MFNLNAQQGITYKYVVGMQKRLIPMSEMQRSTRNFQSSDVIERSGLTNTKIVMMFKKNEATAAKV